MAKRRSRHHKRPADHRVKPIPRLQRVDVTRDEFNRVIDTLNSLSQLVNDVRHDQEVQFKRIAQLQAEIDQLRALRRE